MKRSDGQIKTSALQRSVLHARFKNELCLYKKFTNLKRIAYIYQCLILKSTKYT